MADDATLNAKWLLSAHPTLCRLSPKEIAARLGVVQSTVSRLRNGKTTASSSTINAIARESGLDAGRFYDPSNVFRTYAATNFGPVTQSVATFLRLDCTEVGRSRWAVTAAKYGGRYLLYNRVGDFGAEKHFACAWLSIGKPDENGVAFQIVNIDSRMRSHDGLPQRYDIEGRMYPVGEFLAFAGEEDGNLSPVFMIAEQTSSSSVVSMHGFILAVGRYKGMSRSMARSFVAMRTSQIAEEPPREVGVFPLVELDPGISEQLLN